jgi:nicotinate-nucleotide pyrophosphorylase (carboxylating)
MEQLDPQALSGLVAAALEEDLEGGGPRVDVTTEALIPPSLHGRARLVARQELVVAGLLVAREVFAAVSRSIEFRFQAQDGEAVQRGDSLATVSGPAAALLVGERTALNFLQRMSGIATATRAAVREVEGTGVILLDTRKTAPGLRALDKYAVAVGGGFNHRRGLYDAVMIKDTHLALGHSVSGAVAEVLARGHPPDQVTVEVRTVDQLREAIAAGAGRALLDNMSLETLTECVRIGKGRIVLEASGGLRPGTLRAVAQTGVDALSLGWLTHSAPAADIAMEMEPWP